MVSTRSQVQVSDRRTRSMAKVPQPPRTTPPAASNRPEAPAAGVKSRYRLSVVPMTSQEPNRHLFHKFRLQDSAVRVDGQQEDAEAEDMRAEKSKKLRLKRMQKKIMESRASSSSSSSPSTSSSSGTDQYATSSSTSLSAASATSYDAFFMTNFPSHYGPPGGIPIAQMPVPTFNPYAHLKAPTTWPNMAAVAPQNYELSQPDAPLDAAPNHVSPPVEIPDMLIDPQLLAISRPDSQGLMVFGSSTA